MSASETARSAGGTAQVRAWTPWLLLAIVGMVFAPVWSGDFVYDDRLLIAQNPALRDGDLLGLLARPWFPGIADHWRPATGFLLWLGHALGGATGIHVLAWSAHLLAVWFAWRIGIALTGRTAPAFAAALLFGLHPVQVEGVAWCSALSDPLWVALGLWCLDSTLRSAHASTAAACLLALLAKETAVLLVPLALALRWARRQTVAPTAIAVGAAAAAAWALRAWAFGSLDAGFAQGAGDTVVRAAWPTAALEVFGRELTLLVWPWPSSPFRALELATSAWMQGVGWGIALAVALGCALWRRSRSNVFLVLLLAAPPLLAAAFCHRLGTHPVADRYLGPAVLAAALLAVGRTPGRTRLVVAGVAACVAALASVRQTAIWRDQAALVAHGLAVADGDPGVLVMAGNLALERGDTARARSAYTAVLATRRDDDPRTRVRAAVDARIGLGMCLLQDPQPDIGAAIRTFTAIVGLDADQPVAWIGLGIAHGMAGDADRAEQALRRAIALAPADSRAHYNLAFLLERTGRRDEARASARAALRCDPGSEPARALLDRLGN